MPDEKNVSSNGNQLCGLRFLISYLIGHRTIKMSKSNQSVHGFWIHTVTSLLPNNNFKDPRSEAEKSHDHVIRAVIRSQQPAVMARNYSEDDL